MPTNARFWTIPANGTTPTPDQPIQSYELQPHTTYELNAQQLSFTTGAGRDDTPPTEPGIGYVSITLARPTGDVASLAISGTFDQDTAVVRVRLVTANGWVTYYTTPDALHVCDAGIAVEAGPVHVEIVALDLAGNASSPATFDATATFDPAYEPFCGEAHHHVRCGTPLVALVYFAPFIGLVALVVLLLVVAIRSGRRRGHAEVEPLSLASATFLARAVRLRAHITLAAAAVAGGVASLNDGLLVLAFIASPVLVWLVIAALVRWAQASQFSRLLGYDGVTAEVHGDRVTIVVGGKVAFLRASPRLVERAKRNALPRASL